MAAVTYFGESSGARVFQYGSGLVNIGKTIGSSSDYQLDIYTWDIVPSGEVGDNVFRSIDVSFNCSNGYSIGITPIVDGVALNEQTFNGAGTGEQQTQAFFAQRGTRLAARVRTLVRQGDIEMHNVSCSYWQIRANP